MKPCRILIADDHELVRRGVRAVMEAHPGLQVCGEAGNGRDAVEKARELKPDVVILDISMPGLNGLEATRQILKAVPRTEVLILTIHESEQVQREVLAAGARGYILKSDDGQDLISAVDHLRRHRPFFTTKVTKMVLDNYLRTGATIRDSDSAQRLLTPREREITQLLAEGNSNKEIASILGISVKTVETHRTSLLHKLDLHSLSDVVHYAIRNNMVEP